ncbi:hypothetical protein MARA_00700 (plasmid) [Mycolicibacterium arabiense]|uniref:Serine/threonine protein kinase n=1 Tax=Mycolicibacterium arabiense TaxID=1286181 RepID=A0A7I7RQS0_9MYCO|nr:hypothetical protein MARA_00700 [Mycolicibacterium arabiense]
MTLGPVDEFAGYTVVRQLGSGGMGEVYLAKHPRLPRLETLEILRPDISTDDTFRQRFIREADSIAGLEHPNTSSPSTTGATPTEATASWPAYAPLAVLGLDETTP